MPAAKPTLNDLRREIDSIDDAIHDLLMQRAGVVEKVAATKRTPRHAGSDEALPLRPGREAAMMRRLVGRHSGSLQVSVVARIWREIMAGNSRIQANFSISVSAPEGRRELWDMARDHFGSTTPITAVNAPVQAIRAVIDGTASVAVVAWPDSDDRDPWWRALLHEDAKTPRIIARLPVLEPADPPYGQICLAIARMDHEDTGKDHTFVGLELSEAVSRSRLREALVDARLPPVAFWNAIPSGAGDGVLQLVEINGFVDRFDARLADVTERLGDAAVKAQSIGGFPVPIRLRGEKKKG